MDTVLTGTMKTLYSDMSSFIKTVRLPSPAADKAATESSVTPMNIDNNCSKCEKLKKHLEQIKTECTNKDKQIATLETELGRLRHDGLGRRLDGGYYDRDYNRKGDRDRDRDQDRGR